MLRFDTTSILCSFPVYFNFTKFQLKNSKWKLERKSPSCHIFVFSGSNLLVEKSNFKVCVMKLTCSDLQRFHHRTFINDE